MSTEGRSVELTSATRALESAGFVRLVVRADGDALAASGLLASALTADETPFQVTVGRTVAERSERVRTPTGDDDVTIVLGSANGTDDDTVVHLPATDRPATLEAVDYVREIGSNPDPVLALAGVVASGGEPGAGESEWLLEAARDRGLLEQRPGVAVPTADTVDGLAHTTRVRAPWSGDLGATRDALDDIAGDDPDSLTDDDHRTVGSLVALDVVGAEEAADVAATTIGRVLRPYATPDRPFATLGGFADVLEATARTEPGTGAALAMGHDVTDPALSAWRDRGRRAHAALAEETTGRYDGLFVVSVDDGPVEAVARIAADYLSPEPAVLAVGTGEAAVVTRDALPLGATVEGIARELEEAESDTERTTDSDTDPGTEPGSDSSTSATYDVGHRRGYLRYDPGVDESTIIATVRDLL
ncbi:exonuclease [Natrinema halophilum]|uniref:Exonuclease n=1 Tax=Natrinema halophilum TaxID=1699371 RepID=A0A7D5GQ04_9EURY|nr:exonuclease [Natrinema halophilum]QLG47369.1 exonuclease [Natrinema halophilum]